MDSNCEAQYYEEKYDNKILALNRETMLTVIQNTAGTMKSTANVCILSKIPTDVDIIITML